MRTFIVLGQRLGTLGISEECMLSGTEGVTLRFPLSVSALLLMLPVYLPVSGSFITSVSLWLLRSYGTTAWFPLRLVLLQNRWCAVQKTSPAQKHGSLALPSHGRGNQPA